jgi:hypothetical protein
MHDIVLRLRFVWPSILVPDREFMDEQRFEAADEIERLREALQAVVDAHGTGQGVGAQGVGGWLDQARKTLEGK